MFGIAMIPPLWFALMDQRVITWANGDLNKVNISPDKKEKYKSLSLKLTGA